MTFLDRFLQRWRIRKSIPYIPNDSVVLDVGCHRGQLFTKLGTKLRYGVGIDPILEMDIVHAHYELLKDSFPTNRAAGKLYHCITILAVLEHIPHSQQEAAITACYTLLQKEGFVILTIPDKRVDKLLGMLRRLGLIKGMQLEEHYGFEPADALALFSNAGFELVVHKKFQLGLNNLFVFKKPLS